MSVTRVVYPDDGSPTGYFLGNVSLFGNQSSQEVIMPRVSGEQALTTLRHANDSVVSPGDHWMRNLQWIWGQHYAFTSDAQANTAGNDESYQLFAFEVEVSADALVNVSISSEGAEVAQVSGPAKSVVFALPGNSASAPWVLTVGGHGLCNFSTGFELPFELGNPRY